ncbi:MAG: YeeE/YedE family protein [Gammaproteobacteria bacterium]|nr:YeeE/YedE family protein [Gammaproteobacteria bacterium]
MQAIIGLAAGLLFGLGLIISGMTDPSRVIAFLDVADAWNPSLAFVMASAIAVALPAFSLYKRRGALVGQDKHHPLPDTRIINRELVAGNALFGIGWGLCGICPGPAVVLVGHGSASGLIFTAAMIAGMLAYAWYEKVAPGEQSSVASG